MKNNLDKLVTLDQLLNMIPDGSDVIIPLGNGAPEAILNGIDNNANRFTSLTMHQILELKDKKYIHGTYPHIKYYSYFMSGFARRSYNNGTCELVPNHFHQVPRLLETTLRKPIVVAQATTMDENGYFSLGLDASYAAYFIGKVPFYLQVNSYMPRTFGENKIHLSQIEGYINHDEPLVELPITNPSETDQKIASFVAERINDGSTLQVGIGGVPNAVISMLKNHHDLGIHSEMITDGMAELVRLGAVTGTKKKTHVGKMIGTFILGTNELYDFINENEILEMLPVNYVNNPLNIAREDNLVTINATTEVDFYGQCASETVVGKYYSSSGGQADFGTGVRFAKNGKGFICLYSTAKNDTISRIRPTLANGSVVTTSKNDVDYVVTEFGIAELKGCSISERAKKLISIAHPKFQEELTFDAKKMGLI